MALDMDEFLCLHAPLQTLDQWFGKLPEADQIFVNWAMFGNSGHTALTDDLVTSRFHLASVRESGAGKLRSFKTLFRREAFQRPGIHMPRGQTGHPLDQRIGIVRAGVRKKELPKHRPADLPLCPDQPLYRSRCGELCSQGLERQRASGKPKRGSELLDQAQPKPVL
jgi:hypothetical protein